MHDKLKKYFEEKGITQQQIADALGVSLQYVNQILNGKKFLGKKNAERLANLFGLSKSFLLTGEGYVESDGRQLKITERAHGIQMAVLGHIAEEPKVTAGIAAEEDPRPYLPAWADTLLAILSKQIAENEVLHQELKNTTEKLNEIISKLQIK